MNDSIIQPFINYIESQPNVTIWLLLIGVLAVCFLIYKLARSEDISVDGKVEVKYHSPTKWLKRFQNQVDTNRAGYSDKQNKILSFMHQGYAITQAFGVLLFGFILTVIGAVSLELEPSKILDNYALVFLVLGLFCLGLSVWLYRTRNQDNPFSSKSDDS